MKIKNVIFWVLAVVVAGFFLRGCFLGDEGHIRKQLKVLEGLVSYEAGEGDLQSLGKVKRLGSMFVEDVEIKLSGFGGVRNVKGRKQVQQAAMAGRSQVKSLKATLHDITVELAVDNMSAIVQATGRAKVSGENSSLVQDFVFVFRKTEEGWLIAEVETVEALR